MVNLIDIKYKNDKSLEIKDLEYLFLSVNWSSGNYPEKLKIAIENSDIVFTAWHDNRLVGLINALDDSIMTAYIHYLLVDPIYQKKGIGKKLVQMMQNHYQDYLRILLVAHEIEIPYYELLGFKKGNNNFPLYVTSLPD